jgi:CheY-like chemotaxis protein
LLAGRKLLLADDSITIQKVVELTFADEGVGVVCVNNGKEAIERLEDFDADVVLADVFMPLVTGYELCEYIKQNEKLRQIPVMLLVGSFEPFDEAEARRVGADDTLTKPFQSIRRLIDKVGVLMGGRPSEEQVHTAEFPKPEAPEPEKLSEEDIALTTADTQPLPPELSEVVSKYPSPGSQDANAQPSTNLKMNGQKMETKVSDARMTSPEDSGELLLDLGDFEPASARATDEFELDIDLDEVPQYSPTESESTYSARHQSPRRYWNRPSPEVSQATPVFAESTTGGVAVPHVAEATLDQLGKTQEFPRMFVNEANQTKSDLSETEISRQTQPSITFEPGREQILAEQLSPEIIDAIARRAVEHLSERVIQEIAWEVVPQLAELMIKRQLEEKNS